MYKKLRNLLSYLNLYSPPLALPEGRSVHEHEVELITGKRISLGTFKKRVLLIVNTASKCGFTPQYRALEELYQSYKERGLTVIGCPSNDFAQQEPGTDGEIKSFCEINYGVTFPLLSKCHVKGEAMHPLFHFLTTDANSNLIGSVKWNFEKFLLDQNGELRARWSSITSPTSRDIIHKIEQLLKS